MSKKPVKRYGNPVKNADPNVLKLFRTMRNAVELVGDLSDKLSDKSYERLRASALGLMFVHSELAKMPKPDSELNISMDEWDNMMDEKNSLFLVKPFSTTEGLRVVCQRCYNSLPYWQMAEHSSKDC